MPIEPAYNVNKYTLAFQRGEEEGFDFFFRQLFPSLCFFANRIINNRCEAEDIASSAFIKIWNKHSKFDDAKNIRSYLYQIVRNDCFKFLKQNEKRITMHKDLAYLSIPDSNESYESDIIRAEVFGALYKALNRLPKECDKVFRMLYIDGKKVSEIAKELKLSPSTIKAQKARGLKLVKKNFANHNPD